MKISTKTSSELSNLSSLLLKEEREFYEGYQWVLMPFLSFNEIIERLKCLAGENLGSMPEWCRREWNINLYLLSSAVADLVDDHLARGVYDFSKISDYIPLFNSPVKLLLETTLLSSRLRINLRDRSLRQWRKLWSDWLISVCMPLAVDKIPGLDKQRYMKDVLTHLLMHPFPRGLMMKRMRIPAAYRSQDLTHHDFLLLSGKYVTKHDDKQCPYVIVGIRTAGSYIAPLICAYLKKEGYRQVSYITIRPKSFISPWDENQIKEVYQDDARFILVDEPPYTGKAISRCIKILNNFGIENKTITIIVPTHPAKREWLDVSLRHFIGDADVISLEPGEWYKEKLLKATEFQNSVSTYFSQLGFGEIEIRETEYTEKINEKLLCNPGKEYHVRLKKVFQVIDKNSLEPSAGFFVMAKSVGWGWLGYHAALIASRLSDFIPRVYGVCNGIMYLEWIDSDKRVAEGYRNPDSVVSGLSDYISQRTNQLRLNENPTPFLKSYMGRCLQSIAIILSKTFGPKVSKLKTGWVRKQLKKTLICTVPSLTDSRMMRDEWIVSKNGLLKTDFEHHGFSKTASPNIVDPAYDLAAAMFEFDLSDRAKDELIGNYIRNTGDVTVVNRIFYYKLLYGSETIGEALNRLNMTEYYPIYHELNNRYIRAWNFLVSETARYSSNFCQRRPAKQWSELMFVMDIDDVFDKNIFGFPSTTADGIRAISLLRLHNVCSVINTARSVEEVKDYCRYYGFAGGIAEYGSVLWDDINQYDEVLVSQEAVDELRVLQYILNKIPGIFTNPFYKYSIRAYNFIGQRPVPVSDVVIGELFSKLEIKHLTFHRTYTDTAIYDSSVDKGKALIKLKDLKGMNNGGIAAVGDSAADLPMLIVADHGYLVNNSTVQLKRMARYYGISVLKSSFQSGLLDAVDSFLHGSRRRSCKYCKTISKKFKDNTDPFFRILQVADRSPLQHWFRVFDKNIFEAFQE